MTFDYNLNFDKDNKWAPFKEILSGDQWKYDEDNYFIKLPNLELEPALRIIAFMNYFLMTS